MKLALSPSLLHLLLMLVTLVRSAQDINVDHQIRLGLTKATAATDTLRHRRLGVLGAGPAGISVAKHIHGWAHARNITVDVTVLGLGYGRCLADVPYNTPPGLWAHWVESGSYGFSKDDRILSEWIEEKNVSIVPSFTSMYKDQNWYLGPGSRPAWANNSLTHLGIWDGTRFIVNFTSRYNHWQGWWKDLLGHEQGVQAVEKLVHDARRNFSRLYDPPVFPFTNLTEAIRKAGLEEVLTTSAPGYLRSRGIGQDVIQKILQTVARRSRGTDITSFGTALPALMSLTDETPMVPLTPSGWFGFYKDMCMNGGISKCLDPYRVLRIKRNVDGHKVCTLSQDEISKPHWHCFDDLVIAAPFVQANLEFEPVLPDGGPPNTIKTYNFIWTSFIATPHTLNPEFFNAPADIALPDEILTTCFEQECEFFNSNVLSVIKLGNVQRPPVDHFYPPIRKAGPLQNLYQLSTRTRPDSYLLMHLFSGKNRTVTSKYTSNEGYTGRGKLLYNYCDLTQSPMHISPNDISWLCSRGWNRGSPRNQKLSSYEKLPPVKFDHHIWYTSGMENVDSSMEAAALMGANVANLIVEKWARNVG